MNVEIDLDWTWPELQEAIDLKFIEIIDKLFTDSSSPTSEQFWNALRNNNWPM